MTDLYAAIAALMPSWAYFERAPRDQSAPYAVWVVDTAPVDDTSSAMYEVQITVDGYARDTAVSAASALADQCDTLDGIFVRGHISCATGSSSLVVRADRTWQAELEDDGVGWVRSVYTTQWITTE